MRILIFNLNYISYFQMELLGKSTSFTTYYVISVLWLPLGGEMELQHISSTGLLIRCWESYQCILPLEVLIHLLSNTEKQVADQSIHKGENLVSLDSYPSPIARHLITHITLKVFICSSLLVTAFPDSMQLPNTLVWFQQR